MQFRTIGDLEQAVWRSLDRFPDDIDLVVGIPRSGLMAASIVALSLNLPFVDLDGFVAGRSFGSGRTRKARGVANSVAQKVLLVDDSIRSGTAMRDAVAKLRAARPDIALVTCAVFAAPDKADAVDLALELVDVPRLFQWNAMHHVILTNACLDMDGVLCVDPTHQQNDDGPHYLDFLREAKPLHLPKQKLGAIVTSRLERYRAETEDWLGRHGITYDKLVMLDVPDAATRRKLGLHGRFKGEYYRDSGAELFVESERQQSEDISLISGKPVLWIGGPMLFKPDADPDVAIREAMTAIRRNGKMRLKGMIRRTFGDAGLQTIRKLRKSLTGK